MIIIGLAVRTWPFNTNVFWLIVFDACEQVGDQIDRECEQSVTYINIIKLTYILVKCTLGR